MTKLADLYTFFKFKPINLYESELFTFMFVKRVTESELIDGKNRIN